MYARYRETINNGATTPVDQQFSYLYDYAGRRLLKRAGDQLAGGNALRTRYFFNGLTEEIKKVSVGIGTHSDISFRRLSKFGSTPTTYGPKTEPGTGGAVGWPVVSDTQRRRNVYEITDWRQDGTHFWSSGNGYDITGYRTFATWLKQINTAEASEFVIHLDTNQGRKGIYYRPNETTSYTSGTNIRVVSVKDKAGDFNDGPWVRLERDFVADATAAWPGIVVNRVTGIHVYCANNGKVRMDGLTFSNSLTVEENVLSNGPIGHIVATRKIDSGTFALTKNYLHYDQVGSVMTVSNAAGTSATPRFADAFGNALTSWDSGLWAEPIGWGHNTKETDGDLDLVYMYQRWYDSKLGVFLSRAPYPPHTEHAFGFIENSPGKFVDPEGLLSFLPTFPKKESGGYGRGRGAAVAALAGCIAGTAASALSDIYIGVNPNSTTQDDVANALCACGGGAAAGLAGRYGGRLGGRFNGGGDAGTTLGRAGAGAAAGAAGYICLQPCKNFIKDQGNSIGEFWGDLYYGNN